MCLISFGCGDEVPAQRAVDITLDADACIAAEATRLELRVIDATGTTTLELDQAASFPTGVRVLARDETSTTFVLEAELFGQADLPIANLRYTGTFPGETDAQLETIRAVFDDGCLGHICSEACVQGRCVPSAELVDRDPSNATECPDHLWVRAGEIGDCSSPDNACGTVREALDAASQGALVEIHGSGTYEPLLVDVPNLVLRAWPGTGTPQFDADDANLGIQLRTNDITLDGLEIFGAQYHGISINGALNQRITIRRCDVHDNGFGMSMFDNHGGLMVNNDATDIVIEDSVFRDNITALEGRRDSGLHINSGIRVLVRNNEIRNNSRHGIFVAISADVTIENNIIAANGFSGVRLSDADLLFENNLICGSLGIGAELQGDRPITLRRNTIIGSETTAVVARNDSEKRVEQNILAMSGNFGLVAEPDADLVDTQNLYFDNAEGDAMGFELDTEANVFADPQLLDAMGCSDALAEGSPAVDIGSRL